jgi:hypothetical protein
VSEIESSMVVKARELHPASFKESEASSLQITIEYPEEN